MTLTSDTVFNYDRNVNTPFIGLDEAFKALESAMQKPQINSNFPPMDIVKVSENETLIELALAGYAKEEIEITLEKNSLKVFCNNPTPRKKNNIFLHNGIACRKFTKEFIVSDTIQVNGASFKDGILSILLVNVVPEKHKLKKIELK